MNCTIDASVFVSATRPTEKYYSVSLAFLDQVQRANWAVFCPVLVLPECAAAVARASGDEALASKLVALITAFPRLHLEPLSLQLAQRAAQLATVYRLRGGDATYLAVAEAFETILVTWDREMLDRAGSITKIITPEDWLTSY